MLNQSFRSKTPKVYTGGTFDLPHHGHFRLLQRASEFGEVVVGLNTDEFIFEYRGSSPIMNFEERREILLACRWVDEVVPNYGGADSKIAIDIVKPDYIIIGSDWARKDYYKQMGFTQDWLDGLGIGLIYVPYTAGISSTDLKTRIGKK
jgi:glycerol-3-phosphate cytidylyltransferase